MVQQIVYEGGELFTSTKASSCKNDNPLTFTEATLLLWQDCSSRQGNSVHLHTRDATTEVTSVSSVVLGTHSHRIVGGQLEASNTSFGYETVIHEELGISSPLVVGRTDELPATMFHTTVYHRCGLTTIASCEADEQLPGWCHPEVNTPSSWVVVEDRSRSSGVLYPSQKGHGILGVQFASVSELSITVYSAKESVGTSTCFIGTTSRTYTDKSSSRITE